MQIEIPEGHRPFTFSVVGFIETEEGLIPVHTFGWITAGHDEYARRGAIKTFHQMHPTAKVNTVGVAEMTSQPCTLMKI